MKKISIAILILLASAYSSAAEDHASKDVSRIDSWLTQDKATGDWGGARSALKDEGVTISSNYTADISGNPVGGIKQCAKYSGFFSLGVALDLQKIMSVNGLALTVSNYLATGRDLAAAIGSYYSPQQVYTAGSYYFGEVDLSLCVMEDTVIFETGRIFAGDVFAVSPFFQYYLTSAVNGRLAAVSSDVFFPHYRTASWGVRTTYQPNQDWHVVAGLYDANQNTDKINNRGADFSFDMDSGYLAVAQLTYKHGHKKVEGCLPGSASFGAYYESSRFDDLSDPTKRWRGNSGYYILADQMIYKGKWPEYYGPEHMRSGARQSERCKHPYAQQTAIPLDRPTGLSLWTGATLAPQEHINAQVYEIATGAVYQGLPPGRDRDITAFCFVLGHFSGELQSQSDEMIVEFNHRFQVGPWAYVTPDVQYIINPNGQSSIENAFVLGFEAGFNF